MVKSTTAASRRTAAKTQEFQAASETEAKSEGAAAPADQAEVKAPEVKDAGAADLAGTTDASAAAVAEIREQAEAASTDRKDAAEEGTQPEDTAQPPVADAQNRIAETEAIAAAAIKLAEAAHPERRAFPVNWDLNHDGKLFRPDGLECPELTEAEFNALRPGGVVGGDWDDGEPVDG